MNRNFYDEYFNKKNYKNDKKDDYYYDFKHQAPWQYEDQDHNEWEYYCDEDKKDKHYDYDKKDNCCKEDKKDKYYDYDKKDKCYDYDKKDNCCKEDKKDKYYDYDKKDKCCKEDKKDKCCDKKYDKEIRFVLNALINELCSLDKDVKKITGLFNKLVCLLEKKDCLNNKEMKLLKDIKNDINALICIVEETTKDLCKLDELLF